MSDFRIRFLFCLALIILLGGCKPDGFDDNPSVEAPEDIPQDKPAYEILTDDTYSFKLRKGFLRRRGQYCMGG